MRREIPYESDAICDECGRTGAFDVYGDYLCTEHFFRNDEDEDERLCFEGTGITPWELISDSLGVIWYHITQIVRIVLRWKGYN